MLIIFAIFAAPPLSSDFRFHALCHFASLLRHCYATLHASPLILRAMPLSFRRYFRLLAASPPFISFRNV